MSAWLRARLTGPDIGPRPPESEDDPLSGEDFHLTLGMLYELHHRGIEGVDDRWEWDAGLLGLRRNLEDRFEEGLRRTVDVPEVEVIPDGLRSLCRETPGRKATDLLTGDAAVRRIQEHAIHLSAWQLRSDAHAWAIPRLDGRPKAALLALQAEAYAHGQPHMHSELFALTMERLGLSSSYNAYIDELPGVTLSTVNVATMFGLQRRWLGALVGHLAMVELSRAWLAAERSFLMRMHGFDPWACLFHDASAVSGARHRELAVDGLAEAFVEQDIDRADEVMFGAAAYVLLEQRLDDHLAARWQQGRSSLRNDIELPERPPGLTAAPIPDGVATR